MTGGASFDSLQSGTPDNGDFVSGEIIAGEKFTNFHFDEVEEFGIVDLVNFVHEYNDEGTPT
jgi:hypothetical protein